MKIFYFLKIIFDISTSKRFKNIKKNYFKQKKLKSFKIWFALRSQTLSKKASQIYAGGQMQLLCQEETRLAPRIFIGD
jgi:hypothetical protein